MKLNLKYEACFVDLGNVLAAPTGTWRFQKPVVNVNKCCFCGWCYIMCPTGSMQERGAHFDVDFASCKGCGICADICPNLAIKMVKEVTE